MKAVPTGGYTLYSWESIPSGAWLNAKYLSRYESKGKTLTISGNSPMQLQLQVIPAESQK